MVAVYVKELLSWYLITLGLRETIKIVAESTEGATQLQQQQPQKQQQQNHHQPQQQHEEAQLQLIALDHQDPKWIISIKEKLKQASQYGVDGSWAKICIYRVPHFLRGQADDKAYTPQVVSIGPYHRQRMHLRAVDPHKWRALHNMLKRNNQSINIYLAAMKKLEQRAMGCYQGPLNIASNDFVEMLVLDGCFMLEFFRGYYYGFEELGYGGNDPIFSTRGMMYSIRRDMLKMENQIPLFVLDKLLRLQSPTDDPIKPGFVEELALVFFTAREKIRLDSYLHAIPVTFDPLSQLTGLHCVDLFRRGLLRKGPQPFSRYSLRRVPISRRSLVADQRQTQLIHCVMDLKEAGISFKKRKTDRFWDIKFKNGVLQIPRLLVHDGTKSLFLNLVAFEQCHSDCNNDITAYVFFMDNLINSAEDVSYLHYCGIIEHWLGSDAEVADMFNHLCREVAFDINDSYLSGVCKKVNRYYTRRWNIWMASLTHKYFYNPWAIISLLAAVLLLLLTSAQTFYSVYGYYNPRN